jgi:2-polyprenyl-3-methyl-5-hydroxy-6-metoxy-1,4-benzoquinol methylase
MKYAKDVVLATARNVLHKAGVLYQRRYDPISHGNQHYDLKLGYASSHSWALDAVPAGARVLDIGAGPGGMARELVNKGCTTAVVDQHPPTEADPSIQVHVQNLDEPLRFDVRDYDHLLLLDVIEHLKDPERFMAELRQQFDYKPRKLVLTTPNVAFIIQRLMLLGGQFNYGKAGILDRTHTRLFTFRSLRHLLRDNGFRIKEIRGVPAPFPKVLGNGLLGKAALGANLALIRLSKSLFSYQIYVEAETTPDVSFVLKDSKERSALRDQQVRKAQAAAKEPDASSPEKPPQGTPRRTA